MGKYHWKADFLPAISIMPPLALAAAWEAIVRVPLPLPVYAVFGGLMVTMLVFAWKPVRRVMAPAVVLISGLLILYAVPWTTRKAFVMDLYKIKPGMTEGQANAIMHSYVRGSGWPPCPLAPIGTRVDGGPELPRGVSEHALPPPPAGKQMIFRHSDARFDSDWGIVLLNDGRVVSVDFSAD